MTINPVGENILVRVEREEKTAGGIIIPDEAKNAPEIGTVISVGTGRLSKNGVRLTSLVKPGDKIIFSKYAAGDERWDSPDQLIITEHDLFGVIEPLNEV